MRILKTTLYVLACISLSMTLVACASQAQFDAGRELIQVILDATDPAGPGGEAITLDEQSAIDETYARRKDAEGLDWKQLLATLGTAAAAAIPGLRYGLPFLLARIPNEQIIGKPEALALDKAARIT